MFINLKKLLRKNQGSAAIILSLMVSFGVLSTIYFTGRITGGFLSKSSQLMDEWEAHLVVKSAQALAAYLVTNNLVMCREGGWDNKKSNCRWSMANGADSPSQFNLSNEMDVNEGLSYTGTYKMDDIKREYKATFNLVDWTDTSIQNLIGQIPGYVCRNKTDLSIIRDAVCVPYQDASEPVNQPCHNKDGTDVANSVCEYVREVDNDHFIVLITVKVDYNDPVSDVQKTQTVMSGIRRPLSSIKFASVVSGKRCSRACSIGSVASPFPNCRGDTGYLEEGVYTAKASNIVSIVNEGPGSIYSLSLIRSSIRLSNDAVKMDVTPDIVKYSNKEVFLPGETIKFEYFYDCSIEVKRTTVYQTGSADSVDITVQNQLVPFEKFLYGFNFNAQRPKGVCYTSPQTGNGAFTATDPDEVDLVLVTGEDRKLASASCNPGASSCSANGKTGTCQFVQVEPRRIFKYPSTFSFEHNKLVKNIVTTITTAPPPPSTLYSSSYSGSGGHGDGGDGCDGIGDGLDGHL